jgi:tRNA1Val (adenine37-N6)-methyltransferase
MPNSWFQFKHFRVEQDQCAMKVNTDSVLLGAIVPLENIKTAVDLGAGTGLLSLMLAQREKIRVHAIEQDKDAALQCAYNFMKSPWPHLLESMWADVHGCRKIFENQFDMAICNPPYFENHLGATEENRHNARHLNASNSIENWFDTAFQITNENGKAAFILPYFEVDNWCKIAEEIGWNVDEIIKVKPNPNKEYKRAILLLKKIATPTKSREIIIETEMRGEYSIEFQELVKDFYL